MSIIGRTINSPVSIYDIQQFFGNSEGDLATLMYQLKDSINKWSKYKPVYGSMIDTVTGQFDPSATLDFTNDRWNSAANWFRGNTIGLVDTIHVYGWVPCRGINNLATVLSQYGANGGTENGWQYIDVAGGANSPYRLQDWAGYDANAYQPQTTMSCPDKIRTSESGVSFGPNVLERTTDAQALRYRNYILPKDVLKDIATDPWNAVNRGFAIVTSDYSTVKMFTTDRQVMLTNGDVSAGRLNVRTTYKVCMFYTDQQFTGKNWTNGGNGKFATLPFMEVVDFEIEGQDGISGFNSAITAIIMNDILRVTYIITNNNTNTYHLYFHVIENGTENPNVREALARSGEETRGSFSQPLSVRKPRTVQVAMYVNQTLEKQVVAIDSEYDPEFDPDNP